MDRIGKITSRVAALPSIVPSIKHESGESQYKSLNDAFFVTNERGFLKGNTEIWYMKPDFFRDGIGGYDWLLKYDLLPIRANLGLTHVFLGEIAEHNPNRVYSMMQGESWSPNGEAQSLIRRKKLHHTSMSVGDIIRVGGRALLVDMAGFKELKT